MSGKQQLIETLTGGNATLRDVAMGVAVGLVEHDEIQQRLDGLQTASDHIHEPL